MTKILVKRIKPTINVRLLVNGICAAIAFQLVFVANKKFIKDGHSNG